MGVASVSSSPVSAADLQAFFTELQGHEAARATELADFFTRFEDDFREARGARAVTTPHLNVLRVFGLEFAELRHSAVLAWFLDANAEHEQGSRFADALLKLCNAAPTYGGDYTVVRERYSHTDVAVFGRGDFAIFIENKVRHSERENQVADMVEAMIELCHEMDIPPNRRFAVFLTDRGVPPETGPEEKSDEFLLDNVKALRRIKVFQCFLDSLPGRDAHSPLLNNLLESYLNAIRRLLNQLP